MSCIFSLPVLSFAETIRKLLTTNRFPFYLLCCENLSLSNVNGKTNKRRVIGAKETCSSHTQKSRMCYKTKDSIRQNTTRQQQINNNHDDRMREIALLVVKLLFLLGPSRVSVCFLFLAHVFPIFPRHTIFSLLFSQLFNNISSSSSSSCRRRSMSFVHSTISPLFQQ